MREDWEQVQPNLTTNHLDLMLAAFPDATIWRWLLYSQDEMIFPDEVAQYKRIGALKEKKTLLNLCWGPDEPFISRKKDFKEYQVTEV